MSELLYSHLFKARYIFSLVSWEYGVYTLLTHLYIYMCPFLCVAPKPKKNVKSNLILSSSNNHKNLWLFKEERNLLYMETLVQFASWPKPSWPKPFSDSISYQRIHTGVHWLCSTQLFLLFFPTWEMLFKPWKAKHDSLPKITVVQTKTIILISHTVC